MVTASGYGQFVPREPKAFSPNPTGQGTVIQAPNQKSVTDTLKGIQASGVLPEFKATQFTPTQFTPTANVGNKLGDDFFNSLEQQAQKRINDQYFGKTDSLLNRQTNQINQRGLIGSGVEQGAMSDLNKSFGSDLVDLQSNIAQQKAQAEQQVEFKNADINQSNTQMGLQNAQANAQMALQNAQKNQEFEGFLAQLGLSAAGDEARNTNDFNQNIFKSQVDLESEKFKAEQQFESDILGQLNDALGNNLIDKETRDALEGIFATNVAKNVGTPGQVSSFQNQANTAVDSLAPPKVTAPPAGWQPNSGTQRYVPGKGYTTDDKTFRSMPFPDVPNYFPK